MAESLERALEVLDFIDANCERERWVNVGMALHDEFGDAGWDLFNKWSSGGENYVEADVRSVWKSFKPGGGRTFATLVQYAKEDGGYDPKKAKHKKQQVSPEVAAEQQAKAAARRAQHDKEEAEEAADAALRAQKRWADAKPASPDHPYLKKKGVKPHGMRVGKWRKRVSKPGEKDDFITLENVLQIPMLDSKGAVHGLQGITATGDKLFMSGAAKKGKFFKIGAAPLMGGTGKPVVVMAEGVATAASIHEATGHLVFAGFDLGNMLEVARQVKASKGDAATIILACDNDTETKGNPGRTKATALALELGLLLAVPPPGDFNDLAQAEGGADAIMEAIEGAALPTEAFVAPEASGAAEAHVDGSITVAPRPTRGMASSKFGEPVDLFNLAPPAPLPLDCFPASIANYAADQAARMGCDAGIVAMSATVAAASSIPDDFKIQPKRHDTEWRESPRIWAAIVGDPSTQKSPGMAAGVRHVKAADVACSIDNKAAEADFIQRREKWKGDCARDGKGSHPEPKPPQRKRRMVGDVTVEALSDVLADNPAGLLCFKDELSGWFGSMDAYKGGGKGGGMDRAHWLEAYNGGPRTVDRVTRGSIMVPNFSVCMLGGIQPAPMKKIASSIDHDGLLQRFIILVAQPGGGGADRAPDAEAKAAFERLFTHLGGLQPTSKPVVLDEAAHVVRERVQKLAHAMGRALSHDHVEAWLGKWAGLFARLLLVMHVCECADRGIFPTDEPVGGALAAKVERLLCDHLLRHAIYFYTEMVDANQHHEHVRQLARLIVVKEWHQMDRRQMQQAWKAYRTLDDREVNAVINALCHLGWLEPQEGAVGHDGKPNRWDVNPLAHARFAEQAAADRQRREEAVKVMRELRAGRAANDSQPEAA